MIKALLTICIFLTIALPVRAITLDALIDSVLAAREIQDRAITDITLDSRLIEKRTDSDGNPKEIKEYDKEIFIKKIDDSLHIYEQYLSYTKNGEPQPGDKLVEENKKKKEEKAKRGSQDLTYDLFKPFRPEHRPLYNFQFSDDSIEQVNGYYCFVIRALPREESDSLIDATYYIDSETFQPVRVEFTPARLVKQLMFKLKSFRMSMTYQPYNDSIWLPEKFTLHGEGKAALLFNVFFRYV